MNFQRWPQSIDSSVEQSMFKIYSYRSAKETKSNSPSNSTTIDRIQVLESPVPSEDIIVTTSGSFTVQVKNVPRKGNHMSRRRQAPLKPSFQTSDYQSQIEAPLDAVYEGFLSSPHIKPQYIQQRRRKNKFSMRAHSSGVQSMVPQVQGVKIEHPQTQDTGTTSAQDPSVWHKTMNNLRHPLRVQRPKFEQGRSINRDLQDAPQMQPLYLPESQPKQPNFMALGKRARRLSRPTTQPEMPHQSSKDSTGYYIDNNFAQHRLEVNMTDERQSMVDSDAQSGGSGMRVNTVYDNSSPTRILLQHNTHLSSDLPVRMKIKRQSERVGGYAKKNKSKRSSIVQLTDFLKDAKVQQRMEMGMAELLVDGTTDSQMPRLEQLPSHQNSQDLTNTLSQDGTMTAKVTDYNTVNPDILLPKLNNKGGQGVFVGLADGHATTQEVKVGAGEEFTTLYNTATRSDIAIRSEQMKKSGEYDNWSSPMIVNSLGPPRAQQPKPPTAALSTERLRGSNVQNRKQARGKILIQKGELLTDYNFSHTVSSGKESPSPLRSQIKQMQRNSSMLTAGRQPRLNRIIQLGLLAKPVVKKTLEGFRVEAKHKPVVTNMWAEQKFWDRKRNAMSSAEIVRQQTLLNNLCMVTKPGPVVEADNSDEKPTKLDHHQSMYKADQSDSEEGNENDAMRQKKKTESGEDPPQVIEENKIPDHHLIYHMQQKRESQGISTANANTMNFHQASRDESAMEHSQKLLYHLANQGLQCFQINSDLKLQDPLAVKPIDTEQCPGIVATSQDGGTQIIIKPAPLYGLGSQASSCYQTQSLPDANTPPRVVHQKTFSFPHGKPMTAVASPRVTITKPMTAAASPRPGAMIQSINDYDGASAAENNTGNLLHSVPSNGRSTSNKVTSVHTAAKRAAKQRQMQMKDVFNLGELRSQNLKGIKVSRLNDLGQSEHGNPLHQLNLLQQQLEKNQMRQTGGEQTKELVDQHAQEKWQTDAIQDFACSESRFNGPQETNSIISFEKLFGGQAGLLSSAHKSIVIKDKLKSKKREHQYDMSVERAESSSSASTSSLDSSKQRFQANMVRHLINDTKSYSPGADPIANNSSPKQSAIGQPVTLLRVLLNENDTLMDDQSLKQGELSVMTIQYQQTVLTPHCKKIELQPKECKSPMKQKSPKKHLLEETVRGSREMAQSNRTYIDSMADDVAADNQDNSRNHSERQSTTTRDSNKDLKGLLQEEPEEEEEDMDQSAQMTTLQNPDEAVIVRENDALLVEDDDEGDQETPYIRPVMKEHSDDGTEPSQQQFELLASPPNNNKRLESSDGEEGVSQSQMNPMGIEENSIISHVAWNEYNEKICSSRGSNNNQVLKVVTPMVDTREKHRVYSVYEASNEDTLSNPAKRSKECTATKQFAATMKLNQGLFMKNQLSVQNNHSIKQKDLSRELNAPVSTNMTTVKNQKSVKSRFDKGDGEDSRRTLRGIRGTSLIKHVDQSLEQARNKELRQGKEIVVNQQYKHSSGCQTILSKTDSDIIDKEEPQTAMLHEKHRESDAQMNVCQSKVCQKHLHRASHALQSNILERLSAVNSVLAPHLGNGYQQLEPKMFSSPMKDRAGHYITPLSIESGASPPPILVPSSMANQATQLCKNYMKQFNNRKTESQSPWQSMQVATPAEYTASSDNEDNEAIGFISHTALENHLHNNRMIKGLMERDKRKYVKQGKAEVEPGQMVFVDQSLATEHGTSVISSQQFSVQRDGAGVNAAVQTQVVQQTNSRYRSGTEVEENDRPREKEDVELRQICKVEKEMTKCINLEKLLKKPIAEVQDALQDLIGPEPKPEAGDEQFRFKPKRSGMMNLDSVNIAQLYQDHLCYEFPATELHELLGENVEASKGPDRRYFLKFTGLQIVNVDCQSGIVRDIEPISLPIYKMINLFFLSSDQLQQVLGKSLQLIKKENQLILYLDQDALQENMRKMVPRVIREDYFWAPMQISIHETIEENLIMVKDSFNLEIRLPRLEIIATALEHQNRLDPKQPLYKTTMSHNLSGRQMMTILCKHHLIDWATYAKQLIKERKFGVETVQADGDASIIKFQRLLNHGTNLVLYKDPDQLKQEQSVAQNLQLTMMVSEKFTMQVAFLRPVRVKLLLDREEDKAEQQKQHLPGYLPESYKGKGQKPAAKTITSLLIPFTRLPFLKQTFGAKIEDGSDGCLLKCLYDLVELHVDTKRDILRMEIPSWRQLEEINIRQLSQRYFEDKKVKGEAQRDSIKYMGSKARGRGEVKAILNSGNSSIAPVRQHNQPMVSGSIYNSLDYSNVSMQDVNATQSLFTSTQQLPFNEQVPTPAILSTKKDSIPSQQPPQQRVKHRRLQINDYMVCKLKICRLVKAVYAQDLTSQNGVIETSKFYEAHKKVTLAEFFTATPQ